MDISKILNHLISFLILALPVRVTSVASVSERAAAENAPADTSLSDVMERGTFVVGADIPYGVMEFYDETGKLTGIDIDIAREIALALDADLEVKNIPFHQLFDAVIKGEIDAVISAVTITQERQKKLLFSAPYLDAGMLIAVRSDNTEIASVADLKGKRIGVLKGTLGEDLMAESDQVDQSLVRSYEKNEPRIRDLLDGKIDAMIVHFRVKDHDSIKTVGRPLTQAFYGVATNLNSKALMGEIDRVLREMKRSGRLEEIRRQCTP